MRFVLLSALGAACAACVACAPRSPRDRSAPSRSTAAAAEIAELEARLARHIDDGDVAALDSLLGPTFRLVGEDTTRTVARASWIANTRRFTFDSVVADSVVVTPVGDAATAALRLRFRLSSPGEGRRAVTYHLTDRWARHEGAWRLAERRLRSRAVRPL